MTDIAEYQQWLASGTTDAALIETIEVFHAATVPAFSPIFIANWGVPITCTLETAAQQAFVAGRFLLEPATTNASFSQGTSLTMSSLDGVLYRAFRDLTYAQRQDPIKVRLRAYMSNDLTQIVTTPPPVWTLRSVTANFTAITGELSALPLRVQRIGRYFTSSEFPVLALAR